MLLKESPPLLVLFSAYFWVILFAYLSGYKGWRLVSVESTFFCPSNGIRSVDLLQDFVAIPLMNILFIIFCFMLLPKIILQLGHLQDCITRFMADIISFPSKLIGWFCLWYINGCWYLF